MNFQTTPIEAELKKQIEGEIHFDPITRHVYSVDASIFEVEPLGVVIPKSKEDLIKTVQIAYYHHIPIIARGAATGITGGCLGRGIIIDTSKYLNRIMTINIDEQFVICEPGVIQDDLNTSLSSSGYRLGPDTSTGNRATLGGMLANNAAGARSLRYGKMVDHIQAVELILADGQVLYFSSISKIEWEEKRKLPTTEGYIYNTLWQIKERYAKEIQEHFPNIPRRVCGYNLDELIKTDGINIAKLIAGSEGTLGIVTSMQLQIAPKIKSSGLCLVHFDDLLKAFQAAPHLLNYHPLSLEIIDDQIIELGRHSPSLRGKLDWLHGHPKGLLIVEFDGKDLEEVKHKLEVFNTEIQFQKIGYASQILVDPNSTAKVWTLRKAGLGILLSKRTYSRAIAFLEDISVSPYQLASFMERFCDYLASKGKTAGIYGHAGSGCMHIRPYIDLRDPQEIKLMHQMMLDISDLLLQFGGSLSGEHGDGLIRSWLNPKMFGEKLNKAFIHLKQAFDPHNCMNPGKIVLPKEPFESLRTSPDEPWIVPKTFLNFKPEGGFDLAADLCNGNGECRKKTGIMCPSFQATQDEFHSTRARAQALRSIIHGRLPLENLTSEGMHDVMDLCIQCKGCKTECPSQVDMAKMKAEFLYQYQQKHGYSLRTYLFGHIDKVNRWLSPFAKIFNYFGESWLSKKILSSLRIASERTLPALASPTFSKWLRTYRQSQADTKQVILFNDTFTEYNEPSIGKAAVHVLNALGYKVIIPPHTCCGRPALSKGLLEGARYKAEQVIDRLIPYASQEISIIGLEPSCILTIKEDYQGLVSESKWPLVKQIASCCITFDEFVDKHLRDGHLPLSFKEEKKVLKVHGHCHQKALVGMDPTMRVLRAIPNLEVQEIPSGCCGMAGSFGYEAEHYAISMKIGALVLFPAIKSSSPQTAIVANGTSCRHQIKDGTGHRSLHLAELLASLLK